MTASKFGVQSGVLKSCSGVEFFRYKYRQGRLLLFYYTAMLSIRHKSWKERNHEDAQTCMPSKNTPSGEESFSLRNSSIWDPPKESKGFMSEPSEQRVSIYCKVYILHLDF